MTAGTDCTVSQHLWDLAVNCSIAQDRQLQSSVTNGAVGPGNDACPALCGAKSSLTSVGNKTTVISSGIKTEQRIQIGNNAMMQGRLPARTSRRCNKTAGKILKSAACHTVY